MRTAGVAFGLSLVLAVLLTPVVRRLAHRFGLLDHVVGSRKVHGKPVPRVGGIAIILAAYAPLLALRFVQTGTSDLFYSQKARAISLLVNGAIIGALGIYDDVKGANALKKFGVQIAVAVALYLSGYQITAVATPFGRPLDLGVLALPVTVIWIVGVINAMNLIDGLDGLAGGVAFFAVGTTFLLALTRGDPLLMLLMGCLGGALLGFLLYNFNPASIFMGDTGSMFLGMVLAAAAVQANQKSSTAVTILVPIVVLGLPIADTLLAMSRRAVRGRPIFSADREHIHHRLLALGLTHRGAVLTLYGCSIALSLVALLLARATSLQAFILLLFLTVTFVVAMRFLGFLRIGGMGEASRQRRRNRSLRTALRACAEQLTQVAAVPAVWPCVKGLSEHLSAVRIQLSLWGGEHAREDWENGELSTSDLSRDSQGVFSADFQILDGRDQVGVLRLWWLNRTEIDRDEEIVLEVLCAHISNTLRRLPNLHPGEPRPKSSRFSAKAS